MLARTAIFLDSNAGAPLRHSVTEGLLRYFSGKEGTSLLSGNPSSIHSSGRATRKLISDAETLVLKSLCSPQSFSSGRQAGKIQFTSSGTDSIQTVIRGVAKKHWITSPAEHSATLRMLDWSKSQSSDDQGIEVSLLPLLPSGAPDVEAIRDLYRDGETSLVSVLHANNETGVLTDIARAAQITQDLGIKLHVDAAQTWGKIPLDLPTMGANYVSLAAHKIGAFAGTGVIWTANGEPLMAKRLGTENVIGSLAAGLAAETIEPEAWSTRVTPLRDRLEAEILARIPGTKINGSGARVGNTTNLCLPRGQQLVVGLDLRGFRVSSGSACASGAPEPSHVLRAMGLSREEALRSIRVSLPDTLEWNALAEFVDALATIT